MSSQHSFVVPPRHSESWKRLWAYTEENGRTLVKMLGWGGDGLVYSTTIKTAIKSYLYEKHYIRERDAYFRLAEHEVSSVAGFDVPQLVFADDDLWIVEMQIVAPPFVLDFAGAYLDAKPPYDAEQWADWEQEKMEQFEDRWPQVLDVISEFRRYGIYLSDVKPGNITFEEDRSE